MSDITVELTSGSNISVELKSGVSIGADIKSGCEITVEITGRGPMGPPGDGNGGVVLPLTNIEIEALLR